jgi:hypothetical protein
MNVFVKPRLIDDKPALVRDPLSGKPLAEGGEWKTRSQFWIRRIAQGDVIDETAEQTERQKAPATALPVPEIAAVKPQAVTDASEKAPARSPTPPPPRDTDNRL